MEGVKVVVVGAGVIGFSTAVCIAEALPSCSVTLVADKFSPDTTSDGAAGILFAAKFPDVPLERQRRWFKDSFDHLLAIAQSQHSPEAGVMLSSGWQIFREAPAEIRPFWSEFVIGFRLMTDCELKRFPDHTFGQAFTTIKYKLQVEFNPSQRYLFYGYICCYLSCLFGHRPGVFANMTNGEVEEAKTLGGQQGYLIHIKKHKTNKSFGEAQLFLTPLEFSWLERWLQIKKSIGVKEANNFVLFTKGKGPSKNLNTYLQMAWSDMGLGGNITFTLIRTALDTYAKKTQDTTARKRFSDFMCHNTKMADRYYVSNPDYSEAAEVRALVRDCIEGEAEGDAQGKEAAKEDEAADEDHLRPKRVRWLHARKVLTPYKMALDGLKKRAMLRKAITARKLRMM